MIKSRGCAFSFHPQSFTCLMRNTKCLEGTKLPLSLISSLSEYWVQIAIRFVFGCIQEKNEMRIKAWEPKICFLRLREYMIPTDNISLTYEHYALCVLPRPRSQPCWCLHVEFRSNLGNKMAPTAAESGSRHPLLYDIACLKIGKK